MLILSVCHGGHDSSAVVADDYDILAAVQTERVTRAKGDGQYAHIPTVDAALNAAGIKRRDIQALASSGGSAPARFFHFPFAEAPLRSIQHRALRAFGREPRNCDVARNRNRLVPAAMLDAFGLRPDARFFLYNHHFAHALSALFFTDWSDALLYTADGGGDSVHYSMNHFTGDAVRELYDDRSGLKPNSVNSAGLAYGFMTEALGFRKNRHEGKITGLAAYGQPAVYDELASRFAVGENGLVQTDFADHGKDMRGFIRAVAKKTSRENAAASVQKLLEELIVKSVRIFLRKTGASRIALAGGVFANVALNRKIAELPEVDEVFIFPAMTDDGLAVGGLYQFLLQRDGLQHWLSRRRRLRDVYWGGEYDDELPQVFAAGGMQKVAGDIAGTDAENIANIGDIAEESAKLLADGKIVALFCGRMEFGPRALGARSILASPAQRDINDTLNARLGRTEFMPFAPYVLEEDADEVFDLPPASRYAARFMTVTCKVRERWREKIPAVVHVDGTARPQVIRDDDNPLYAEILRRFKRRTGLPILVNTSFNAHEEPIIRTADECLRALRDGRVDYVAAKSGLWSAKCAS